MADKIFKGIVLLNKKQYNEYYESNPVLKNGCPVICVITPEAGVEAESKLMMKIGDGTTAFRSLPWLSGLSADVYDWALQETKPTYTASEIAFNDGENFQQKYDNGELTGPQGDASTVTVGTVTTLPAGSNATVTNSGTASAAILNFGIPRGEKGGPGEYENHASRHATGGTDVLTPAAIGAVAASEKGAANGIATLNGSGTITGMQACSNVVEHYNITTYTMSTNDVGKAHLFTMPSGSQATTTVTLPASLPIGAEFEMLKGNIGTTLVVSAGTGATILTINKGGQSSVRAGSGKYALITLKRYNQNWWYVTGGDE